jgi:hypothetical protein
MPAAAAAPLAGLCPSASKRAAVDSELQEQEQVQELMDEW